MGDLWNWDTLRVVNFTMLFISFCIMVYRGVYKAVFDRKHFYWARFMNLVWCFVSCVSIGDLLYRGYPGGWRIWMATAASVLQLWIVLFKSPYTLGETDAVDIPDVDLRS